MYDGDGNRIKATVGSTTTAYLGNYFEYSGSTMKKTYYAGTTRVAVRVGSTISYLLTDHLGSTAHTINTSGIETGELRYKAWGETRYTSGSTPTSMRFTGQRQESTLGGTEGLYFYGSRWYDPALGRWAQPDSDVPKSQGVQALDRYAYVNNSPVNFTDSTGHRIDSGCTTEGCTGNPNAIRHTIYMGGFPSITRPDTTNFGTRAEESYDPSGNPDPSGPIGLVNDALDMYRHYQYNHDPSNIFGYLNYEEYSDKSVSLTSILIENHSNLGVSMGEAYIIANPIHCIGVCLSGPSYNYPISTSRIGTQNSGLGVVVPRSSKEIGLIPSGSSNPGNTFVQNYSIRFSANFYQYTESSDSTLYYRSLSITLNP